MKAVNFALRRRELFLSFFQLAGGFFILLRRNTILFQFLFLLFQRYNFGFGFLHLLIRLRQLVKQNAAGLIQFLHFIGAVIQKSLRTFGLVLGRG